MDENGFRGLVARARGEADKVIGDSHTAHEAKEAIYTLLEVVKVAEQLMYDRKDAGADQRILQKRHDQLKGEFKEMEKQLGKFKEKITAEVPKVIKGFSSEIALISERGTAGDAPLAESASRMRMLIKQLVEALTKV